jgi:hypothetical protein
MFATVAGASLLSGCGAMFPMARCEDMQLPARLRDATEVRVHDNRRDQLERTPVNVIAAPAQIERWRQFVLARQDGWHAPIAGVPVGRVRTVFWRGDQRIADVSLGRNFLEAQGCGYFFIRTLTNNETAEAADLIGWQTPLTE